MFTPRTDLQADHHQYQCRTLWGGYRAVALVLLALHEVDGRRVAQKGALQPLAMAESLVLCTSHGCGGLYRDQWYGGTWAVLGVS